MKRALTLEEVISGYMISQNIPKEGTLLCIEVFADIVDFRKVVQDELLFITKQHIAIPIVNLDLCDYLIQIVEITKEQGELIMNKKHSIREFSPNLLTVW